MKPLRQIALVIACATAAQAGSAAASGDAGQWNANFRWRHESVDDDAFARGAQADTMRLRLGWQRGWGQGWRAGVEFEGVVELGDRFNSGANGQTAYPVVADPRALELNQAWLAWRGERSGATLGRQRVMLDNQRFVGNVGWRQNEQTFDALSFDATLREGLLLRYHYLDRVHRVSGDEARDRLARERDLDAHLGQLAWTGGWGTVTGYAYRLHDQDVATASTRTLGLRWTGTRPAGAAILGWSLEYAGQRDSGRNPLAIDEHYLLLEPSLAWRGVTWKLGHEVLGGNGSTAFQTPLATLHAFNGWADKFTVTPAAGLRDDYLSASGKTGFGKLAQKLAWTVAWHDYRADHGGADYGHEWNASLGFPLPAGLTGLVKFADYRSDGFARDTRKLWLQVEWNH